MGVIMKIYIALQNGSLTIKDSAFQEVADEIEHFTKDQIIKADLPEYLLFEIASGGWDDTDQREQIMDHLAKKYLDMSWPCYGDSVGKKILFDVRLREFKGE